MVRRRNTWHNSGLTWSAAASRRNTWHSSGPTAAEILGPVAALNGPPPPAAEILGTVAARNSPPPPAAEILGPVAASGIHCCWQGMPSARPQGKPHASIIDGRRCRRRGNRACRLHALRLAGAAAGLASAHAAGIHRGLQGPPPARYQHRPLASIVAGRSCRRRGHEACGWHALWLSGAASGAASAHASCIHRCGCRRATGARRLHPLFRAGPAIFKASTFAACIQGGMLQLVRKEVLQAWCAWSAGWGRSTSTIDASGPCPSQREAWP